MHNTQLTDRTLWFDGDSSYPASKLLDLFHQYDVRYVDKLDPSIVQYNELALGEKTIGVKTQCEPLKFTWNIPDEYKTLEIVDYVIEKFDASAQSLDDWEYECRALRIMDELAEYRKRGLHDVLRVIIFIINTLTAKNAVWGIGRGSSVSSYVLYLIGAHDVDSYAYGLDIGDFLRD